MTKLKKRWADLVERMKGLEQGVVRFSPSHFTSDEEIETVLQTVRRVAEELS